MNGSGSGRVAPSIETCPSCIASRSADWVPGEERLAGPGHVLEQDVAADKQRGDDQPKSLVAPDDRLPDLGPQVVPESAAGRESLGRDRVRADRQGVRRG